MNGQKVRHSILEAVFNIIVGMGINMIAQLIIFPAYGIRISLETNVYIVCWFTAVSLARSFVLRRAFNWYTVRQEE